MSKLGSIKLALSKILASFSELKTSNGILYWASEEEIRDGLEVYILDENGEYSEAPDGEYIDEAENTIVVKEGRIESITPKPEEEPAAEETPAEETVAAEETPEVESPSGEEEPTPDAIEEIRKEINELYDIIDKLVKEVADIKAKEAESAELIEKMSKMSAAMSAQEEVEKLASTENKNVKFNAALEGIKAASN